ncbi:MAG: hypothetical protein O7A67_03055, partial [SAR324 cluster bacterium]|nr:hypothetical protein [SAR324 cluster bacterium]
DSALADDRQDRALLLILLTAALNLAVDALSRRLRARLRLKLTPEMEYGGGRNTSRGRQIAPRDLSLSGGRRRGAKQRAIPGGFAAVRTVRSG